MPFTWQCWQLKQLYADNHFAESDHSKECIANLYRSADSVKAFTDDMLCHKGRRKNETQ